MEIWLEITVVILLISLNGFFAMAELAVLSARKSQLRHLAESGSQQAQAVLDFRTDSNRFLASIQVGITLVGILVGVFSGATLAGELANLLAHWQILAPVSKPLAMMLIVMLIGFLTLVFGELVPKQIGLRKSVETALNVARPIHLLSRFTSPVVHLLTLATDAVLRLLQLTPAAAEAMSEDEIILLLEEGHRAGSFDEKVLQLVERVFDMSHSQLAEQMTHRRHMTALNLQDDPSLLRQQILASKHSCYPVYKGDPDRIEGLVYLKQLLPNLAANQPLDLHSLLQPPLCLSGQLSIYRALEKFRQHNTHCALVFDQHGMVQGIVSMTDILNALFAPAGQIEALIRAENEHTFCVEAEISLDHFGEFFQCEPALETLPEDLHTLAGLVLHLAGRIPRPGERFVWQELHFRILSMVGPRIAQIQVILPSR